MQTLPHLRAHWLAISCCLTLAGCASAPGMRWLDRPDGPAPATQEPDAGRGSLIAITAQLVHTLPASGSEQTTAPAFTALLHPPRPYVIGPGDLLSIQLPEHPELQNAVGSVAGGSNEGFSPGQGYLVNAEGQIDFPYAGSVRVVGLTVLQARNALAKALSRYLRQPQVMVNIGSFRSQRVYVDGEVRNPGIVALGDLPLTLPDALSRAGGTTSLGDISNLVIVRDGKSLHIDLPALTERGINPMDLVLQHRDLLRVGSREDRKVYVLGEVQRPMALPLRNGRLSLNDALGEAAGPNPNTSNARQIYVVRTASDSAQPLVYHLNAQSPAALVLAEKFPLQAKDVVFVDPAPLATWNRVLSLILPSAAAISTTNTLSSGN